MKVSKINYVIFHVTLDNGAHGEIRFEPSKPLDAGALEHEVLSRDERDYNGRVLLSEPLLRKLSIIYEDAEWTFKYAEEVFPL